MAAPAMAAAADTKAATAVAEGGEVEVVFPSLRPRLALLRQVYQQLQPLLECDLAARQGEAGARELGTGTPPPTPAD